MKVQQYSEVGGSVEHHLLMRELQEKHALIAGLIDNRHVHFADVPMHGNIGDLLIMLGTFKFFERYKIKCALEATYFNYSPSWLAPDEVLVLQGGGNLGDLYPDPQLFRESCVSTLRKNRIIILPQTIHFESAENRKKCEEVFSAHPDLHICVRDVNSFDQAKAMSSNVYLLPDMAHQLWPLARVGPIQRKMLGIFRMDEESSGEFRETLDHRTDWPELVGRRRTRIIRSAHLMLQAIHATKLDRWIVPFEMYAWRKFADGLAQEAIALFSSSEKISTDRLHGHILACVMNIDNVVFDNSYGKNSGYSDAWTATSDIVTRRISQLVR